MLLAPKFGTGKPKFDQRAGRVIGGGSWNKGQSFASPEAMQAAQQAALQKSIAKRRADLKSREQFAAKNQAKQTRHDRPDGRVVYNHEYRFGDD